jgi:chemotaxis protein methyltransferase CheR
MNFTASTAELTQAEFTAIRDLLYGICGINLQPGKEDLVRSRLAKRVQALGLESYAEYLEYVRAEPTGAELASMVDSLTTNKTSFFREPQHFDYLRTAVLPGLLARGGALRLWSAGCSSGEEAYTLGIVLHEAVPDLARRDVRILATDISARMLARARAAEYDAARLADVPRPLLGRYFQRDRGGGGGGIRVAEKVRGLVRFAQLNLMDPWPMRGPFHVIFCRNVMIYFDAATQEQLVRRFHDSLAPGGHLFVGHAESLTALDHPLRYVRPAVYAR